MGITDSTTSISTSWIEQSVVGFTEGDLTDLSACVSEVGRKLKRGTLSSSTTPSDSDVKRWLRRAKMELAELKGFTWSRKYAYVDLAADDYRVALPPDFNGGNVRLKDQTNDRYLEYWPPSYFDMKFPDVDEENSGSAKVFTIKNMELWLAPPVDSADRFEIEYDRSGAETTADDFDWLPEIERWRCVDRATAEAFESLHMFDIADRYFQKWGNDLAEARRADGKRKWKSMNYSCLDVFQAARLKTWQPYRYNRS